MNRIEAIELEFITKHGPPAPYLVKVAQAAREAARRWQHLDPDDPELVRAMERLVVLVEEEV